MIDNPKLKSLLNSKRFWLAVAVILLAGIAIGLTVKLLTREPLASGPEVRIELKSTGFEPKSLAIAPGTTVVWSNDTDRPMKIGANPYPDGTELPEFISSDLGPNTSYSYTFVKKGTFGYTNYSDPTVGGTIIVE